MSSWGGSVAVSVVGASCSSVAAAAGAAAVGVSVSGAFVKEVDLCVWRARSVKLIASLIILSKSWSKGSRAPDVSDDAAGAVDSACAPSCTVANCVVLAGAVSSVEDVDL